MKVFFTFWVGVKLAFWLFILGIALGLALGIPAAGAPSDGSVPACDEAYLLSAPATASSEGGVVRADPCDRQPVG